MNDAAPGTPPHQHTRDILAELEAEVAHELEEERPPEGGRSSSNSWATSASSSARMSRVCGCGEFAGAASFMVSPRCAD